VAIVVDSGALIGFERKNRLVVAFLETAQRQQIPIRTTSGVIAQVWRSGSRQASLARLLRGADERSIDPQSARRIGALLAVSGSFDVIDASVIDAAMNGDEILTSDPDDIIELARAAGKSVTVIAV
jgi:hypothetical protein